MRRVVLAAAAGGLAIMAGLAGGVYWYERPTLVRVAVARDTEDMKVILAAAQIMARGRETVRMRVIGVANSAGAAAAFDAGDVDLAVVRTDINMPKAGQTAVILRRSPAALFAPFGSDIEEVNDLRGKRIGVVVPRDGATANVRLLETILARYGAVGSATTRTPITLKDLPDAIAGKRIDVVFSVGPPGFGLLTAAVAAVADASGGAPVFIPMDEGKAISLISPELEPFEVARGTFGGEAPLPPRDLTTISVSTRLVANENLRDSVVSAITRVMFTNRPAIAVSAPSANLMEEPPTEKGTALPTHPGAAAYLDGDEETFLDIYGDYIYLGAMVLSVIASAAAALASRFSAEKQARVESVFEELLDRLLEAIARAREAAKSELDGLERDADAMLREALATGGGRTLDAHRIAALGLGLDQLRAAIRDRRRQLDGQNSVGAFEPPIAILKAR